MSNTGQIVTAGDNNTYTESPQVDNSGYTTAATIAQAAAVAVATLNTLAALDIAYKQLDLANKYYDLAQEMRDYWNSLYKPCETGFVSEVCATPKYTPQYDVTAGRYAATARMQFRKAYDNIAKCSTRYCTGLTAAQMKDMAIAEAQAVGDSINMAYRYEEQRQQVFDDIRFSRKHAMIAMGRNIAMQAKDYAQLANSAYGNLGQQAAAGAAGAMQFLGYQNNRKEQVPQGSGRSMQAGSPGYDWTAGTDPSGRNFLPSVDAVSAQFTGTSMGRVGIGNTGQMGMFNPPSVANNTGNDIAPPAQGGFALQDVYSEI